MHSVLKANSDLGIAKLFSENIYEKEFRTFTFRDFQLFANLQ
jgi:hypothetical protein